MFKLILLIVSFAMLALVFWFQTTFHPLLKTALILALGSFLLLSRFLLPRSRHRPGMTISSLAVMQILTLAGLIVAVLTAGSLQAPEHGQTTLFYVGFGALLFGFLWSSAYLIAEVVGRDQSR